MESNPYATPKSDVTQPVEVGGRPGWVWVIFILYMFSVVTTIVWLILLQTRSISIPEVQLRYVESISRTDYIFTFILLGINIVAAILLFRMRRSSFHFFMAGLFISFVYTIVHTLNSGGIQVYGSSGVAGIIGGYAIKVAICAYVWRLRNAGRLR